MVGRGKLDLTWDLMDFSYDVKGMATERNLQDSLLCTPFPPIIADNAPKMRNVTRWQYNQDKNNVNPLSMGLDWKIDK